MSAHSSRRSTRLARKKMTEDEAKVAVDGPGVPLEDKERATVMVSIDGFVGVDDMKTLARRVLLVLSEEQGTTKGLRVANKRMLGRVMLLWADKEMLHMGTKQIQLGMNKDDDLVDVFDHFIPGRLKGRATHKKVPGCVGWLVGVELTAGDIVPAIDDDMKELHTAVDKAVAAVKGGMTHPPSSCADISLFVPLLTVVPTMERGDVEYIEETLTSGDRLFDVPLQMVISAKLCIEQMTVRSKKSKGTKKAKRSLRHTFKRGGSHSSLRPPRYPGRPTTKRQRR